MCLNELHTSLIYIHILQAKIGVCLDKVNNLTSSLLLQPAQEPRNTCEPGWDEIAKVWVGNVELKMKTKDFRASGKRSQHCKPGLYLLCLFKSAPLWTNFGF